MTTIAEKRKALGRGLESLLPRGPRVVTSTTGVPGEGEAAQEANSRLAGGVSAETVPGAGNIPAGAVAVLGDEALGTAVEGPTSAESGIAVVGTSAVISEMQAAAARKPSDGEVLMLALELIDENPYQTRAHVEEEALEELTESIKVSGVLQPIVVRPGQSGRYVLIMGERRCEASKRAGLKKIPAVVRIVSDEQAAEMTVIENLQRLDLNPLEQAYAFVRLSREFGLTQEQIGRKTGLSRESVSNYMRLARLPEDVQGMIIRKELDFSMARELLTLDSEEQISRAAHKAVKQKLTVLELESLIISMKVEPKPQQEHRSRWVDPNVRAAQRDLERHLGMRVRIRDRRGKGKIVIEYSSLEDYDRVLEMLKGK